MNQTLERLIGQLIIAGFRGSNAPTDSPIANFINDYNLAGVILYDEDVKIGDLGSRNIQSPIQVENLSDQLQSFSKNGLLICIDQEGGGTNRLKSNYGFPETPSWIHRHAAAWDGRAYVPATKRLAAATRCSCPPPLVTPSREACRTGVVRLCPSTPVLARMPHCRCHPTSRN